MALASVVQPDYNEHRQFGCAFLWSSAHSDRSNGHGKDQSHAG